MNEINLKELENNIYDLLSKKDNENIYKLIDKHIDILSLDDILYISINYNNFDVARYLIKNGANIDKVKDLCFTRAVSNKTTEKVEFLLNYNVDIDYKEGVPLINAVGCDNKEMVNLLIAQGANTVIRENEALKIAVGKEYIEMVKILLQENIGFISNETRIFTTCVNTGNVEIFKILANHIGDNKVSTDYHVKKIFNQDMYRSIMYKNHIDLVKCLVLEYDFSAEIMADKAEKNRNETILEWCYHYLKAKSLKETLEEELSNKNKINSKIKI